MRKSDNAHSRENRDSEPLNNWKRIAQAIWTINYIGTGFRGFLPRFRNITQSLDELNQLIPDIEKQSTADLLENELKVALDQFQRASELLNTSSMRLSELLAQLEKHRAQLKEP